MKTNQEYKIDKYYLSEIFLGFFVVGLLMIFFDFHEKIGASFVVASLSGMFVLNILKLFFIQSHNKERKDTMKFFILDIKNL